MNKTEQTWAFSARLLFVSFKISISFRSLSVSGCFSGVGEGDKSGVCTCNVNPWPFSSLALFVLFTRLNESNFSLRKFASLWALKIK